MSNQARILPLTAVGKRRSIFFFFHLKYMLYFPKNRFVWNVFTEVSIFFFQEEADFVHCKYFIKVHSRPQDWIYRQKFPYSCFLVQQ